MLTLFGIITYSLLIAILGAIASRKTHTANAYFIAKRKLPLSIALPTIVATWFGAGSFMGVAACVYSDGFYNVIPDPFGCALALCIAGLFFAAPLRRSGRITLCDILRDAYGPLFERIATILTLPFYIGTLAAQMLAMGTLFQIITGSSLELGILLGSSMVIVYTMAGGMWAVSITDLLQFAILTVGVGILAHACFCHVPDRELLFTTFINEIKTLSPTAQHASFMSYIGRFLLTGLGAIMGQDLIQRFLSCKSEKIAVYSAISGSFLYLVLGVVVLFIGISGRFLCDTPLDNPEQLILVLSQKLLSPVGFSLFACGLLSAIMSTADSYLLAGSTLFANNLIFPLWKLSCETKKLRVIRISNLFIATIALLLAFSKQSIFDMMVHSGTTLFVALCVPATAALYMKKPTALAAWGALCGGTCSWIGFLLYQRNFGSISEDILYSAAMFGGIASFSIFCIIAICKKFNISTPEDVVVSVADC